MKVAVIGGGAAGMMSALTILQNNPKTEVFLIERNKILGQKVAISGGGRCNVTTGLNDIKKILKCYPRGAKFLSYSMHEFAPNNVMEWFENQGLALKTEKDLRVFPASNKGEDVVNLFSQKITALGGKILLGAQVLNVSEANSGASKGFLIELKDAESIYVDKVIICVGGQAYRHTGSVGDGYTWAEQFGHKVTKLSPSLNAFVLKEAWVPLLAGVSFKNAGLKIEFGENKYEFNGPFMFTHKGITGPAVFAISSMIAQEWDVKVEATVKIDLVPNKNLQQILDFFNNESVNLKKKFKTTLDTLMPRSLASHLLKSVGFDENKNNAEVSKKELNKIAEAVKGLPLTIVGSTAGEEFVTAGGVDTSEINNQTMESKICPGLYFAGEILDVDGFTGGFNLQAAWATGRVAGLSQ